LIHPEVVDIFRSVAAREDFWLDLVSPRLYSLLLHDGPCRGTELPISDLMPISEMFRNLIDFRSPFTAAHSSGVAATASSIANCLGLTETEIEVMEVAGNLHDLGKMAVPNSVINKPDKLTTDEYAIIRQHPYFTYSVLSTIGGMRQIAEWAAFHHEKLDGSGYPFHIDARKLDTESRIVAVADIFTALAEGLTETLWARVK
jgi:HD-GYP domain-containing protein (c-di-GMP phosphodiesterase class II)